MLQTVPVYQTLKRRTLSLSALNDNISIELISKQCSSFELYENNVGKYYGYISLDLSKYDNPIAVIPIGVTTDEGNGYDGILCPMNRTDANYATCSNWTITVGQKLTFYAYFLVIGK